MPLYRFKCDTCGLEDTRAVKMDQRTQQVCKECEGHLRTMIVKSSFQLAGNGWYRDGYGDRVES